jgi:hypothetical protein
VGQEQAAPTASEAPSPPQAPASAAPAAALVDADARVICVTEMQSGSHFKKKTCLTRAQWKKRSVRDRAAVEDLLTTDTSDVPP